MSQCAFAIPPYGLRPQRALRLAVLAARLLRAGRRRDERAAELFGGLADPLAHERERGGAGDAAAAGPAGGARAPADHADEHEPAARLLEHRPAGIAAARPPARPRHT